MLIRPGDIDDLTVPVPAAHAAIVEIGDGGLLVDEEAGRGYPVNATASLLWSLLDSVSTVGELIDDVSATFGSSRSEVAGSVHGLMRTFGELGLLRNVARDVASMPVDIEYVDLDECGETVVTIEASFDRRYLAGAPNA